MFPVPPTIPSVVEAVIYPTPSLAYDALSTFLWSHELETNVILPHLIERLSSPQVNAPSQATPPTQPPQAVPETWIGVWTRSPQPTLDVLLAASNNPLGPSPIFLIPFGNALTSPDLAPRVNALVLKVLQSQTIPVGRVFSVFGPTRLTRLFIKTWFERTGQLPIESPYLVAALRICTSQTLSYELSQEPHTNGRSRLATTEDIPTVALMCEGFAAENYPYVLAPEQARREAEDLISRARIFVHETRTLGRPPTITSMVAVGRTSRNVAVITKIYTAREFLQRGYAKRLLGFVSRSLLEEQRKRFVAIYLGHGNPSAQRVVEAVGFLAHSNNGGNAPASMEDDWLEIGFEDTLLGYW